MTVDFGLGTLERASSSGIEGFEMDEIVDADTESEVIVECMEMFDVLVQLDGTEEVQILLLQSLFLSPPSIPLSGDESSLKKTALLIVNLLPYQNSFSIQQSVRMYLKVCGFDFDSLLQLPLCFFLQLAVFYV